MASQDENPTHFDVIVIGGGPAGIAIGTELSKKLDVAIVEKGIIGKTTKTWVSWNANLEYNDLQDCVYNYIDTGVVKSTPGTYLYFKGKFNSTYPIVDEKSVLRKWRKQLQMQNATLYENTEFLDYKAIDGGIAVETTIGTFTASLLIDASGFNLKLINENRLIEENEYFWSVYGGIATGVRGLPQNEYIIYETFNDIKPRLIWMYMPISATSGIPEVYYLTRSPVPIEKMRSDFNTLITSDSRYSRNFEGAKINEEKYGWVPVNRKLKKSGLNRIAFIGDAAGWTYAQGWGFNYILLHYRKYAERLIDLVKKDKLSPEDLEKCLPIPPPQEEFQEKIEDLSVALIAEGSGEEIRKFFFVMHDVDTSLFEKWLLLELTIGDVEKMFFDLIRKMGIYSLIKILRRAGYRYVSREIRTIILDYLKIGGNKQSTFLKFPKK